VASGLAEELPKSEWEKRTQGRIDGGFPQESRVERHYTGKRYPGGRSGYEFIALMYVPESRRVVFISSRRAPWLIEDILKE